MAMERPSFDTAGRCVASQVSTIESKTWSRLHDPHVDNAITSIYIRLRIRAPLRPGGSSNNVEEDPCAQALVGDRGRVVYTVDVERSILFLVEETRLLFMVTIAHRTMVVVLFTIFTLLYSFITVPIPSHQVNTIAYSDFSGAVCIDQLFKNIRSVNGQILLNTPISEQNSNDNSSNSPIIVNNEEA